MHLWTIQKEIYKDTAKEGIGAFTVGGRWNSPGRHVVYAAENLSLAILEILVHSPTRASRQISRVAFRLDVPDGIVTDVSLKSIPKPFLPSTAYEESQAPGDVWLDSGVSAGLRVPSAIVGIEFCVALNVEHKDYGKITWSKPFPVVLDERFNTEAVLAVTK